MELVKKILPFAVLVGVVSYVLTTIFGSNNGLLQLQEYNGIGIYTFNVRQYLDNLENMAQTSILADYDLLPTREWINAFTLEAIGNNLIAAFDWLYMPFNAILYVFRWGLWVSRLTFGALGIADDNAIMNMISDGIKHLYIPYF